MCLVLVKENEKGLEASDNLVSIYGANSYEEGVSLSNLYNQMLSKGVKSFKR